MREEDDLWYWSHDVSECYYHIQIMVKYRKALLKKGIEEAKGAIESFCVKSEKRPSFGRTGNKKYEENS